MSQKFMQDVSKTAYRYVIIIYALTACYFWYFFYSLWFFIGKNYFAENVSSIFSIQNSNFSTLAVIVSSVFTILSIWSLYAYRKLRNFVVDVGDELSRVSWATFKEVQKSTAVVILLVLVLGFGLFFADTFFQKLINIYMLTAA